MLKLSAHISYRVNYVYTKFHNFFETFEYDFFHRWEK